LGLNQLRILPEYNLPQIKKDAKSLPCTMISNPNMQEGDMGTYDISVNALAKLITENKIDIKKFCLQFENTWEKFNENILLTVESTSKKEEINLLFMDLIKDKISFLAPLQSHMEWKKFGYKYFNPEDRAFFASFFKQCYNVMDSNKVVESLLQVF